MKNKFLGRISKILPLFLLAATVSVHAQTSANLPDIHLSNRILTREQAIENIQRETVYKVVFNTRTFDGKERVDFGRTNLALGDALDKMTEGTGHTYTFDNSLILIYKSGERTDNSVLLVVADRAIAGTVLDAAGGKPQEGVVVEIVNATGKRTTTFVNGRFLIEGIPSGNHLLKLTSPDGATVRYREVAVQTGRDADVTLTLADENLTTSVASTPQEITAPAAAQSTAYFHPNHTDHTIRAFSDEPQSQFSFIPTGNINRQYMPKAAVKTNLLYLATTTLNVGVEFGLAPKWTLDLTAAYNPFQLQKGGINLMWFVQPEARYWFCQRFEKHFIGLHGLYGRYNVGQVDFLTRTFEDHRYKGWGAGAGISYGYHLPMGRRWAWEFTVGVGYVYLNYDKFACYECDEFITNKTRHYFGPTKAGISLIFMIK